MARFTSESPRRSKLNAMVYAAASKLEGTMSIVRAKSNAYASQNCRVQCSHAERKVAAFAEVAPFLDQLRAITAEGAYHEIRAGVLAEEAAAMEVVDGADPEYTLTKRKHQRAVGAYDMLFDASEDLVKYEAVRAVIEEDMVLNDSDFDEAVAARRAVKQAKNTLFTTHQQLMVLDALGAHVAGGAGFGSDSCTGLLNRLHADLQRECDQQESDIELTMRELSTKHLVGPMSRARPQHPASLSRLPLPPPPLTSPPRTVFFVTRWRWSGRRS